MMRALDVAGVARILGIEHSGPSSPIAAVEIDSRRVQAGDLFVALRGARVDGHDFVEAAAERGAVAAITERPVAAALPCLVVADSLAALTDIAAANRDAYAGVLVAITGSCGKTSVKNMCRAIFERAGATVATAGNYNNEIGVPLTLARLTDDTRYAIVEMGATGRGDIAHLCRLARPRISTVLNAMEAHLDGFGSVADVAAVKAEIFDALGAGDWAILNLDQPWVSLWRDRIAASGADSITYSLSEAADVQALDIRALGLRGSEFTLRVFGEDRTLLLPLPGAHNVANGLAAAALAAAAGLSMEQIVGGLQAVQSEPGRLQSQTLPCGTVLIDDSYNANPGSVRAAIELLAQTPGKQALVLGEMLELGEESPAMHAEMGAHARARGIRQFIAVGEAVRPAAEAFGSDAQLFPDQDSLATALPALLETADVILVKGSRGVAMEGVLQKLRSLAEEAAC